MAPKGKNHMLHRATSTTGQQPAKVQRLKNKLKARRTPLTEKEVATLPPARTGTRYDIGDPGLAGFGVRVNDRGQGTYVVTTRFPGSKNPTRREVAKVGEVSLAEARDTARQWIALVKKRVDPKTEIERKHQAELRKKADTFASVAELWLKKHAAKLRSFKAIEGTVRRDLIPVLGHRPIAEVGKDEVKRLLQAIVDDGRPRMAHLTFEYLKGIFAWAEAQEDYGLENSPCDRIKPRAMFGERKVRTRHLTDTEIKAFWAATGKMGYPHGALFRALMLTGARLNEIGEASWREITGLDGDAPLFIIPEVRFKSEVQHLIPLSNTATALLNELPDFAGGDFIFTVDGKRPIQVKIVQPRARKEWASYLRLLDAEDAGLTDGEILKCYFLTRIGLRVAASNSATIASALMICAMSATNS
jgi:Arm DNA-binding domain